MNGRWIIACEWRVDDDDIEARLAEGWEPFAVDDARIHFRMFMNADLAEDVTPANYTDREEAR